MCTTPCVHPAFVRVRDQRGIIVSSAHGKRDPLPEAGEG
jgi:hypothetical protein